MVLHSVVDLHHVDADPGPAPSFQIKAQTLEKKCSNRLIFQTFWLLICKLMRIRIRFQIQLITVMRIRIQIFILCGSGFLFDADAYPGLPNLCGPIRIRTRIHNTGTKGTVYTLSLSVRCLMPTRPS